MRREEPPRAADVKKGISVLWETLQCPICLELMSTPVSTKCDHQFCKFCMMKLLDKSKQNRAACPVCKARVTRRSLQESPGFQKLVTGLQDMIQAYEHDTGTNYFTGMMLPKYPAVVTDDENQKLNWTSEDPAEHYNVKFARNKDLQKSQSSTTEAQNAFAKLMELEDSSPLTTELEGLDSGLGGPPPASEKKKITPTDTLELMTPKEQVAVENVQPPHKKRVLIESSDLPQLVLEEETLEEDKDEGEEGRNEEEQLTQQSSRRKRKKNSDPDKILKQRQKKSVEKVKEWLMNVPSEEDIEIEKLDREDQDLDDSDSSSSASTIDLNQQNYNHFVKEKEGRTKALEDQVFGAVYRRDKKRSGKLSPLRDILTHLSSNDLESLEDDKKYESDAEKEPEIINLSDESSEFVKEAEVNDERQSGKQCEPDLNTALQNVNDEGKEKDVPNLPQMEPRNLRENSRKKMMRNVMVQVDTDLQEKAKTQPDISEQKVDKRKTRQTRSSKANSGRFAKPLHLVEASEGEIVPAEEPKSKLGLDQVQVHIENYPSSEEQDAALVKNTRRSKRLQSFVEEIRVSKKKPKLKVLKSNNKVTSEVALDKKNASPKSAKTNGCIYDKDVGGIETMGFCDSPNIVKPTQPPQEVPNVDLPSEAGHCELIAPNCLRSSGGLDEINTVQESDIQSDPNNVHFESKENGREEPEDDSEIDTEQLLKSFKASKRKSFHLEAPNVKRSRSLDERDGPKTPIQNSFQNHSNSLFSDVIPPSATQTQTKTQDQEEFNVSNKPGSDNCPKSSTSGALSPNKVSKFETPSPRLSVIPQVVDSGLRFTAGVMSDKPSHISESQCSKAEDNSVSLLYPPIRKSRTSGAEHLLNVENSLTPDGLITRPPVPRVELTNSHGSSSTQSSIKNQAKRRKSRRLESSPELESSGSKEFPSLAQILRRNQSSGRDQGDCREVTKRVAEKEEQPICPPRCPSPDYVNSSQASVDLFSTPEETGDVVPVNNASASLELSQYSSELLVTQQKIEMQKELLRLEKLMALVSEVLQEKENSPEHEQKGRRPSDGGTEQQPESDLQSADRNTRAGPSEVEAASKPSAAKHGSTSDTDLNAPAEKNITTSSSTQRPKNAESPSEDKENNTPPSDKKKPKMVLASSGLDSNEQITVKKFAKRTGCCVVSHVTPDVTHVIMHTDERLVCERTLKYFLGIAGRKWVVSFQWISECFKQKKLVDESLFEVRGDAVNGHHHQGPMRARTTHDDDLLMKGYEICFQGPFTHMTTDEMGWMVEQCGATVVKDPSVLDDKQKSHQLVIVQSGSDISASKYNRLSKVATVVTRGWLLDSVSLYAIQNYKNYSI